MQISCGEFRYNQSADIWSFGIVLLELARGKVPLQNCSFTKIIIDTVHGPAPCLDSDGHQKFSKVGPHHIFHSPVNILM